ncbi:uncharacterized protein J3R85_003631 [Psidium guajava]|nr:uncharacterized protein J3R85_003631 [Psidium guajava]
MGKLGGFVKGCPWICPCVFASPQPPQELRSCEAMVAQQQKTVESVWTPSATTSSLDSSPELPNTIPVASNSGAGRKMKTDAGQTRSWIRVEGRNRPKRMYRSDQEDKQKNKRSRIDLWENISKAYSGKDHMWSKNLLPCVFDACLFYWGCATV